MGRLRILLFLLLCLALTVSSAFFWTTRDAMAHLNFLRDKPGTAAASNASKALVDRRPWLTARTLSSLAVSEEEKEYAREAERLAHHEVDQAFAAALRKARLDAQNRTLTGESLELSHKVADLEKQVKQDKAQVDALTPHTPAAAQDDSANEDLEAAKAQLDLDSDELADAQSDLERATGDNTSQIQSELTAHESAMRRDEARPEAESQVAMLSVQQHKTLLTRVDAFLRQRRRSSLLQQAISGAQGDLTTLTAEHNELESKVNARAANAPDRANGHAEWLRNMKARSAERQILAIYDERIQTERELADTYTKWSAQVGLQHRIVLHLLLQSLMVIAGIGLAMILGDGLVRRFTERAAQRDRRRAHTLRSILQAAVHAVGAVLILLIIFGTPKQASTILGLATAALTIALQDFLLAFLGWFILVGNNGIHVGDLVEIDGVSGEVLEVGLFSTLLLETSDLTGKGHPTGRRIGFNNSYAIRGKFFNFSTTRQWMWDEITLNLPAHVDMNATSERIRQAVLAETAENARIAEEDWRRARHNGDRNLFDAASMLSLRPAASGIDLTVRFVTRAAERFEVRNRLNRQLIELLQNQPQ